MSLSHAAAPATRWVDGSGSSSRRRAALAGGAVAGIGSVLLVPELLSKPCAMAPTGVDARLAMMRWGRLDLRPVDEATG